MLKFKKKDVILFETFVSCDELKCKLQKRLVSVKRGSRWVRRNPTKKIAIFCSATLYFVP